MSSINTVTNIPATQNLVEGLCSNSQFFNNIAKSLSAMPCKIISPLGALVMKCNDDRKKMIGGIMGYLCVLGLLSCLIKIIHNTTQDPALLKQENIIINEKTLLPHCQNMLKLDVKDPIYKDAEKVRIQRK